MAYETKRVHPIAYEIKIVNVFLLPWKASSDSEILYGAVHDRM